MPDPARDALKFVMGRYGLSILDTPRSLATLLKQNAKTVPQDIEILTSALTHGVVQLIRDDPHHDPASLARVLVMHGAASEPKAEWAVAAWTEALDQTVKTRHRPEPASATARIGVVLAVSLITAVIGYLIWRR